MSKRLTDPHIQQLQQQQQQHTDSTLPNVRSPQGMPPLPHALYNSRDDSILSNTDQYRSDITGELHAMEYEPPEKSDLTKNFPYNTSLHRASVDSMASRQSLSVSIPPSLLIPNQSDTINEISSSDDEEEPRVPVSLTGVQPGDTLPVTSQWSPAYAQVPVSNNQHMSQDTDDNHMTTRERERLSRSPRRSESLTARRKRQLIKRENVITNSPEITRQVPTFDNRAMSPDDGNFSSLNSEDCEWDDKLSRHCHEQRSLSKREVCSHSSADSSPGPSSLEEEVKGRRPRIVQRMDTDPGELHTKILYGSNSITAAHAKYIQGINLSTEVKVRKIYAQTHTSLSVL